MSKAAYRSGERLRDDYYGETHDYRRKQGVEYSEIIAPEDAPDWARDRQQLWCAVERSENAQTNRKWRTAQVAFELELALPSELDAGQRTELTRRFVIEQCVSRGMVADVNIHQPHREGDQRNHHAHVMLTMRDLTADGFGEKRPEWWGGEKGRKSDKVKEYREAWADYQNREFERLGLECRVDHRSLEAQGIDREPERKMGPSATAMKRKDKESRIAAENDRTAARNEARTQRHVDYLKIVAKVAAEREKFEEWANTKRGGLESAHTLARLDLRREQERTGREFEDELSATYGPSLKTMTYERDRLNTRLTDTRLRARFVRIWTGKGDREKLDRMQASITDAHTRMQEARDKRAAHDRADMARLAALQEQRKQQQHEGIEKARERKEDGLAARLRAADLRRDQEATERPQERQQEMAGRSSLEERLRRADSTQERSEAAERQRQGRDRSNEREM